MKILETERLILRKFTQDDAGDVYEYARNKETTKYLTWDIHPNVQHSENIINQHLTIPYVYAITLKKSLKCIGCIDLRIDSSNKKIEFGFVLNKDYWNNGYMTETIKRIIPYCFENLKANRVEAKYDILNPASGRVMEKCGMKKEGIGAQEELIKGRFVDLVHMAILARDFENNI